jgi:hypothetical protein
MSRGAAALRDDHRPLVIPYLDASALRVEPIRPSCESVGERVGEISAVEVHAGEVRATEIRAVEFRVGEVRDDEVHVAEVCSAEIECSKVQPGIVRRPLTTSKNGECGLGVRHTDAKLFDRAVAGGGLAGPGLRRCR